MDEKMKDHLLGVLHEKMRPPGQTTPEPASNPTDVPFSESNTLRGEGPSLGVFPVNLGLGETHKPLRIRTNPTYREEEDRSHHNDPWTRMATGAVAALSSLSDYASLNGNPLEGRSSEDRASVSQDRSPSPFQNT